jgi:hypothetical protein
MINKGLEGAPSIIINIIKNLLKVNYRERRLDLLPVDIPVPVAEPTVPIAHSIKKKTPLKPFVMRAMAPKFVIQPTLKKRALSTGSDKILSDEFVRKHSF